MLIYKYEVPDDMILKYCRVIIMLEKGFTSEAETLRGKLHEEKFDYVGCNRSLWREDDRRFSTALMHTIVDLTYVE